MVHILFVFFLRHRNLLMTNLSSAPLTRLLLLLKKVRIFKPREQTKLQKYGPIFHHSLNIFNIIHQLVYNICLKTKLQQSFMHGKQFPLNKPSYTLKLFKHRVNCDIYGTSDLVPLFRIHSACGCYHIFILA